MKYLFALLSIVKVALQAYSNKTDPVRILLSKEAHNKVCIAKIHGNVDMALDSMDKQDFKRAHEKLDRIVVWINRMR